MEIFRILIVVSMLLAAATPYTYARPQEKCMGLFVTTMEGKTITYPLDNRPTVTFSDGNMNIKTTLTEIILPMAGVRTFSYGDIDPAGIEVVADGLSGAWITLEGDIVVAGEPAGTTVAVYATDGRLVATVKSSAPHQTVIPGHNLPAGVYIIRADNVTYKILKR